MADLDPFSYTDPAVLYTSIEADWDVPNIAPTSPTQSEQPTLSETLDRIEKLGQEIAEEYCKPLSERYVKQRKRWGIIIFSWNGGCSYTANLNIKIVELQESRRMENDKAGISAQFSPRPEGAHDFSYPEEHYFFILIFCVFVLMASVAMLFRGKIERKVRRRIARYLTQPGGDHRM